MTCLVCSEEDMSCVCSEGSIIVQQPSSGPIVIGIGQGGARGAQGVQGTQGIQGQSIQGAQGIQGTAGNTVVGAISYTHVQNAVSSSWYITHNLGFYPNITVVDSGGTIYEGEIDYVSENAVTLTFSAAFSGKAYLS
jgi:hypothetical protein